MKILLVSTQDYLHHPIPSRHHYLFEILADRHEIHVAHFHVNAESIQSDPVKGACGEDPGRKTKLIVEETTMFALKNPLLHYTLNAPYHYYKFNQIIKHGNYDLVVASNILAGSAVIHAAKKYNVPIIFDLKDWFPDSAAAYMGNPTLKELVRNTVLGITNHNLSNSTKITTVSPSLAAKLKSYGHEAEVITNGANTETFKFITRKDGFPTEEYLWRPDIGSSETTTKMVKTYKYGITDEDFVIGFVGSVERWYGLDDIISVMPQLIKENNNTKLLIVGSSLFTSYGRELKDLVEKLGLKNNVIFAGVMPHHLLPRYIAGMDVCTIPLTPPQWRNIALPDKFFEYTACGKPILTTPIPDMQAMGTNNLYVYNNMQEFVGYVNKLMGQPNTVNEDVKRFDWNAKAVEFENVMNNVIKKE